MSPSFILHGYAAFFAGRIIIIIIIIINNSLLGTEAQSLVVVKQVAL